MQEIKEKIKQFFKSKLNICLVSLVVLFIILVIIPIRSLVLVKISMFVLSLVLGIISYKFLDKHLKMRKVYENIDSAKQEKRVSTFSKISERIEGSIRNNNLMYAIAFGILALLIVVYIIFK